MCEYRRVLGCFNLINVLKASQNSALKGPGKAWNLMCQNGYEPCLTTTYPLVGLILLAFKVAHSDNGIDIFKPKTLR